jgi:hypothetical protein
MEMQELHPWNNNGSVQIGGDPLSRLELFTALQEKQVDLNHKAYVGRSSCDVQNEGEVLEAVHANQSTTILLAYKDFQNSITLEVKENYEK